MSFRILSLSLSLLQPCCLSLSTKHFKGQRLTVKAKGLVWFLSPSFLLYIHVFSLCLLPCLFCLSPPASLFYFSFHLPPVLLWVCVSSLVVFFFYCEIVGRRNCLSWPESGEITLRRGGDCFEWCSMECNAIVSNGMKLLGVHQREWNSLEWQGLNWASEGCVVSSIWPDWTWGLRVGCGHLWVRLLCHLYDDIIWISDWYLCSVWRSYPQCRSAEF